MDKTPAVADPLGKPHSQNLGARFRKQEGYRPAEPRYHIAWIISVRGILVILCLNLAGPLGVIEEPVFSFPFTQFFNILTITLTALYLLLLWSRWRFRFQLFLQAAIDLAFTTTLVAHTQGIDSPFVSFYLLIIIYASLTLGRNAAIIGASLSAISYTGLIIASQFSLLPPGIAGDPKLIGFRISLHAIGFFSVAFLGTYLSHRLGVMERELEEKIVSLAQLRTLNEHIVHSIRSGLITTDLTGRIAGFNSAAEEITGRESAEMLESPVQSLIGDELWEIIQNNHWQRDLRALRYEGWVPLQPGKQVFLGFSISPLMDQQSQLLGYIISFQDLTEIKRLEGEVKLKERMAAVGLMAAGIAHEIRNPLTSMRGSVEVLRSRLSLEGSDAHLLDILIRESDRLNKFVEEFLGFAKPGKHRQEILDLVPLLRDTVALLQNDSGVREKHSIASRLGEEEILVLGTADQLQQVFWNLAQNGRRAMTEGGTLTICATQGEDGTARVLFEDSGVGMTDEEQKQLFQPLQPGFEGGTGLGLSIVFRIMEDHHGKIAFDSVKGKGTVVTLIFPSPSAVFVQ